MVSKMATKTKNSVIFACSLVFFDTVISFNNPKKVSMWYDIEVRLDSHGFNINVKNMVSKMATITIKWILFKVLTSLLGDIVNSQWHKIWPVCCLQ